jgi:hypothetical protein
MAIGILMRQHAAESHRGDLSEMLKFACLCFKQLACATHPEELRKCRGVGIYWELTQRFAQFASAEMPRRLHKTLNWRKFPRLKNGNWFERDLTAYCQIDELRKAGQRMLSAY